MEKSKLSTELSTKVNHKSNVNIIPVRDTNEIYKSNKLIESSYRLTTAQNRLLYMGMSKLKKSILDKNMNLKQVENAIKEAKFDLIYIDVIDYKKKFHIKANNLYQQLEKIASELYDQEIIYFDEQDNITRMRWVITCKYNKEQKGISLQFHPDLIKDLLIFRTKFTRMIFDNFVNIKGKYSFRIYELCKQYLIIGHRDFFVEDLRFKLGIRDKEYKEYGELKRQILKKSVEEINANTDILIDFEEIEKDKKTKKVKRVRFVVKKNTSYSIIDNKKLQDKKQLSFFNELNDEISADSTDEITIIEKLSNITTMDLSAGDAESILTSALEGIDNTKREIGVLDYIKEKVEVCINYANTHKIENAIGLLIRALKTNWSKNTILNAESKENTDPIIINSMNIDEFERKMIE